MRKRMRLDSRAFTLIELLAIIIILSIIAVITVPMILNVIDSSKKQTAIDSAYGYADSVNKFYLSSSMDDSEFDIEDGTYTVAQLEEMGVSVSGTHPSEGWVEMEQGSVISYSLKFGDYVITQYEGIDIIAEKNGNIKFDYATEMELERQAEVSHKVDTYVKATLASNPTVEDEEVYTVAELSGVATNVPDSGWIHFKKENSTLTVYDYSLTYGEITANYSSLTDGVYVSTFGASRTKPALLAGTVKADGAKYLTTVQEVYYNPVSGEKDCNGETGCMHWYLYSIKGNYANMMLDHNITDALSASGVWASESDYTAGLTAITDENENITGYQTTEGSGSKATSAGISYPNTVTSFTLYGSYNNTRGPVTALNTLKSLTSTWTATQTPKVPNSTSTDENIIPASLNDSKYIINYTGYQARLITKEEAGYLGCTTSSGLCPTWMKSNLYGSSTKSLPYGYWTSSPDARDSNSAWYVHCDGTLGSGDVSSTHRGVRPVITVLQSEVL